MQRWYIRWIIFLVLAAFVPLFYYLAVVGGFLPFGAILLIALRNLSDIWLLLWSLGHLIIYGLILYWLAALITRLIFKFAGKYIWLVTAVVLLLLAGIGLLPIYGIAHGQIQWVNVYKVYGSDRLR